MSLFGSLLFLGGLGFVLLSLTPKCWDSPARARQGSCLRGILENRQLRLPLLGERGKWDPLCVINYLALLVCASVTDTLHCQYQPVTLCCRWQGNFLQLQVLLARGSKSLEEKGVHFKAVRSNQSNLAYHTDFFSPFIQRLQTNSGKKWICKPSSLPLSLVVSLVWFVFLFCKTKQGNTSKSRPIWPEPDRKAVCTGSLWTLRGGEEGCSLECAAKRWVSATKTPAVLPSLVGAQFWSESTSLSSCYSPALALFVARPQTTSDFLLAKNRGYKTAVPAEASCPMLLSGAAWGGKYHVHILLSNSSLSPRSWDSEGPW